MVRLIIRNRYKESGCQEYITHGTLDIDAPELEALLNRGGYGEDRFETHDVIDAQVLSTPEPSQS